MEDSLIERGGRGVRERAVSNHHGWSRDALSERTAKSLSLCPPPLAWNFERILWALEGRAPRL